MVSAAYAVAVLQLLGAASQVQAAQPPKPSQTLTTPTFINYKHCAGGDLVARRPLVVRYRTCEERRADPSKSGHFAFLKYHFTVPSVNIDHTDHVTVRYHAHDGITASFSTQEAFQHALDTWSAKDGLVLIAHVPGCEAHGQGERCYFSVSNLQFNHKDLSVVAQGSSKHPDEITTSGETEWGWWDAGEAKMLLQALDLSRTLLLECVAEPDPQTGLPTACLGPSFDDILDEKLGYSALSAKSTQYLDDIMSGTAPGMNLTSSSPRFAPRLSSRMRVPAIRSLSSKRSFWSDAVDFWKRAFMAVYNAINDAFTIGGGFDHQYPFKLPDPASSNPGAKILLGDLREVQSPWGKAILLKRFKSPQGRDLRNVNVFCVGCGVVGHSTVAGRARWSPRDGLSQGHIELTASLNMVLKFGIHGTTTVEQHINIDILNLGLPGLTYGVVTIGPYVTLGAHVALTAGVSGKILAGAEMNWQGSRVIMDITGSRKSGVRGWQRPTFKPIFEASGELFVSAELGLPVGLKVGLKVSRWEAAIGVVDEPSIKATARVGLTTLNNTLTVGFGDRCAGIMTELSWRNRLWVGLVSPTNNPWYDSGDSRLIGKCIG
ncbi:hypothetical protein E4U49_008208 [Claviceps purpurea]|nr:hypothetical protein E4U49_008208 [Claviceps purpurea]